MGDSLVPVRGKCSEAVILLMLSLQHLLLPNLPLHLLLPPPTNPRLLLLLSLPLLLPWALPSLPAPSSTRTMEWHALMRMAGGSASGWVVAATVDVSLPPRQINEAVSWWNQEFPTVPNQATLRPTVRDGIP